MRFNTKLLLCSLAAFSISTTSAQPSPDQMTWQVFEYVEEIVVTAIEESQGAPGLSEGSPGFPDILGPNPLAARLVRLAFHDATNKNGVDAVLNMADPENSGLQPAIDVLDALFERATGPEGLLPEGFTKADFYAWSYIIAVRNAAGRQRLDQGEPIIPDIPVRWGRPDVEGIPEEFFPHSGGHASGHEILDYFLDEFGFDNAEATALMGAHTLGGADTAFSGFRGVWTVQPSVMDEQYFSRLVDNAVVFATCNSQLVGEGLETICADGDFSGPVASKEDCENAPNGGCWNIADGLSFHCGSGDTWRCDGWEQVQFGGGRTGEPLKYQWRHGCMPPPEGTPPNRAGRRLCRGLMLNADIGLYVNIEDLIDPTGLVNVPPDSECAASGRVLAKCFDKLETNKRSPTPSCPSSNFVVEEFHEDPAGWMDVFADVYDRMMVHGGNPDVLPVLVPPPPPAPLIPIGEACPAVCVDGHDWNVRPRRIHECTLCDGGHCGRDRATRDIVCRNGARPNQRNLETPHLRGVV